MARSPLRRGRRGRFGRDFGQQRQQSLNLQQAFQQDLGQQGAPQFQPGAQPFRGGGVQPGQQVAQPQIQPSFTAQPSFPPQGQTPGIFGPDQGGAPPFVPPPSTPGVRGGVRSAPVIGGGDFTTQTGGIIPQQPNIPASQNPSLGAGLTVNNAPTFAPGGQTPGILGLDPATGGAIAPPVRGGTKPPPFVPTPASNPFEAGDPFSGLIQNIPQFEQQQQQAQLPQIPGAPEPTQPSALDQLNTIRGSVIGNQGTFRGFRDLSRLGQFGQLDPTQIREESIGRFNQLTPEQLLQASQNPQPRFPGRGQGLPFNPGQSAPFDPNQLPGGPTLLNQRFR